jgi:hypothetical protein
MFGSTIKRARTVAALGVAAALVVGGVALAQGGSGGNSGNGQSGTPKGKRMPPPPGGPLGGPAGKDLTYALLHVQRNGEAQVIRLDSGKVTAVSDTSISVEENDGSEVTIAVDEDTKVLAGPGRETAVSDLKTGQQVVVCGPEGGTAKTIMLPPKGGKNGQLPPPPGGQPGGSEGGPPQMQG